MSENIDNKNMLEGSNDIIEMHISTEKLKEHIKVLEKVAKKVNRLQFIYQLYKGNSVKEACEILGIPLRTGYNWKNKWNKDGIDGLSHKMGAGRPSFLSTAQLKMIDDYISSNDSLGTKDVHYFIEKKFGIDYTLKQVRVIIKKLKYSWISPYPFYDKSPDTAKEDFKETAKEIDPDKDIYGAYDESSFYNRAKISKVLKKKEKNIE